jgi:hypothetical protein
MAKVTPRLIKKKDSSKHLNKYAKYINKNDKSVEDNTASNVNISIEHLEYDR